MLESILTSGLADLTANDFASAVYNIFFAALVFGAGWLLVQHMQMTHKLRDVEDRIKVVEDRVTNIKEDSAVYRDVAPTALADQEGSHGRA